MRQVSESPSRSGGRGRRRFLGARARRGALALAAAAGLAGTAMAVHGIVQSGWIGGLVDGGRTAVLDATGGFGLQVEEVLVTGRQETPPGAVLSALKVVRGDPILAFSPAEARAALEALPWIRSATVERTLPDTIRVKVSEREALALWQERGQFRVIDADGVVIPVNDVRRFHRLPILVGDDAPQHAATLLAMLASQPELAKRVTAAIRVSGRRWNIRFEDRVEVRLPAGDPASAWERFAAIERTQSVLSKDVVAIDLRLPDRLVVEVPPVQAKPKPKTPGKPT